MTVGLKNMIGLRSPQNKSLRLEGSAYFYGIQAFDGVASLIYQYFVDFFELFHISHWARDLSFQFMLINEFYKHTYTQTHTHVYMSIYTTYAKHTYVINKDAVVLI